jgi:altronate dehydratase small subunit
MNTIGISDVNNDKTALCIDLKDNVAVALVDLSKGDICRVIIGDEMKAVTATEDIQFGHKIALQALGENESVLKYGEEIGKMKVTIEEGGWIHSHNMYCERGMKSER